MGPLETQLRARRLAARERLWSAAPKAGAPAQQPRDVLADISALRRELAALREQLRTKGILDETGAPARPTCALIRAVVGAYYNVPLIDLVARRRLGAAVRPRHVAMYLCRTLTPCSLPEIGRCFGGRDHSTVLHAVGKIERARQHDEKLDYELCDLERRMSGGDAGWGKSET
jgi:chromosomal replication initiation ATPase DnaA